MIKIKGFEKYSISENGEIRNDYTGRILKPATGTNGYKHIQISGERGPKTQLIHRLMYLSYIGPIPEGMQINHIDGDKSNNNITNLEIVTRRENMRKAVETGLIKKGINAKNSRQVIQLSVINGEKLNWYGSIRIASKETGIAASSICSVCCGHRRTAGGFKWRYDG